MSESYLSSLLHTKLPYSTEIEIHFFELCNLRCHFCGQDHTATEGMDTILGKRERVIEFIKNNKMKSHILNLMGGELFSDDIPQKIFDDYFLFAKSVSDEVTPLGHKLHFNWVTNLIFNKTERVAAFLKNLQDLGISTKISTSYDFSGRKNSLWNKDLYKRNLETFRDHIYTVGFVLTKPAIHYLITKKDEFFDYLYENFPIYFDYYVPENSARVLMPSDEDLLYYFLYAAKYYPKVQPVADLLENTQNKMTCYSLNKLTLLPSGREVKCRYMDYKEGDFKTAVDYSTNAPIIESFLEENECLSCDWYSRCGFRCFVQADWSQRVKSKECLFKTFFKTCEKNGVLKWN